MLITASVILVMVFTYTADSVMVIVADAMAIRNPLTDAMPIDCIDPKTDRMAAKNREAVALGDNAPIAVRIYPLSPLVVATKRSAEIADFIFIATRLAIPIEWRAEATDLMATINRLERGVIWRVAVGVLWPISLLAVAPDLTRLAIADLITPFIRLATFAIASVLVLDLIANRTRLAVAILGRDIAEALIAIIDRVLPPNRTKALVAALV